MFTILKQKFIFVIFLLLNFCTGGGIDAYLLPALHAVETKTFQPMSWYDSPPFSDFGRICYIKIAIKVKNTCNITYFVKTGGNAKHVTKVTWIHFGIYGVR